MLNRIALERGQTAVLVCAALGLLAAVGCNKQPAVQAKQQSGPVSVNTSPVTVRQVQREVESVGTLFPYEEVTISSEIDGRVVEVNADLGDRVTEGQVLVRVSEEEQKYLLAENEAQLRQSMERLGLRNEKDRITDINLSPEVRRAKADFFDAEQRYKRVRNLVDQGIGSRQDLDEAQARYQAAQAAIESAQHQAGNLVQEIEKYRAVVELQRKKLRDTTIRAPFTAHVKERQVNVGQFVRPNTPVFVLVKVDPIRLRLEVPERMAPWISNGQLTEVLLDAFPDRKFSGKVWRISPTVDPAKRTFIVEALINNPDAALKAGSYAKGRIKTTKVDTIRLVPVRAVNYVFGTNKVYIIRDGVVETRDVKIGDRFGADVEIMEGVGEKDSVATTQLSRLDTGARVQVTSN